VYRGSRPGIRWVLISWSMPGTAWRSGPVLGEESRDQRGRLAGLGSVGVGREDVTKAGPLLVDDFDPGRCGLLRDPRRVVEQYLCSPDEHEQGRQPGQIRVQRRSQRLPLIAASKVMVGPSRAFVAVAEDRSFRKAAQRLLITQPALSRQIRGLEKGTRRESDGNRTGKRRPKGRNRRTPSVGKPEDGGRRGRARVGKRETGGKPAREPEDVR